MLSPSAFAILLVALTNAVSFNFNIKRCKAAEFTIATAFLFNGLPLPISQIMSPPSALAVSGGGKDYATKDIRGFDFTGQDLTGKDFTQCDATGAKFINAKLSGSRFYRGNLKEADFSGATLVGASLEDTLLIGAKFKGAVLKDSYLSASILDTEVVTDADFTDAQMPDFARKKLCERIDVSGTNAQTSTDTRESLFCE